jgi:hypothetical protein
MIIACKPYGHGVKLIGTLVFKNKPQKVLDMYQTLLLFEAESGNETSTASMRAPVDNLYLHIVLGCAHEQKAHHGQQNAVFAMLVGFAK